jgi:hypothetical protein
LGKLKLRECVGSVVIGSPLMCGNSGQAVVANACNHFKNKSNSGRVVDMELLLFFEAIAGRARESILFSKPAIAPRLLVGQNCCVQFPSKMSMNDKECLTCDKFELVFQMTNNASQM